MVQINNLTTRKIDKKYLEKVATMVLEGENQSSKNFSLALVGPNTIRKANKLYRAKNRVTDVLAFSESEISLEEFKVGPKKKTENLGEIIICPKRVKKNARKYGVEFQQELARVLIHGILHLLGYTHQEEKEGEKMTQKQKDYLSKIKKLEKN